MKLRELVSKLAAKPEQNTEVEFLVIKQPAGTILCCDLNGPSTTDLMRALATRKNEKARVD